MQYARNHSHPKGAHFRLSTSPCSTLIVLLEPDAALRELLQEVLALHGYIVHIAAPGTTPGMIAHLRPQGVIVDVGPIVSEHHIDFLHELRFTLAGLGPAVLLTTTGTWIDAAQASRLRRLHCEILYQPFELQSLLDWAAYMLPQEGRSPQDKRRG